MTPEEDAPRYARLDGEHGPLEARAVARGACRRRRSLRARLAEWQIASKHGEAACGEHRRHGDEERRVPVATRAVRENEGVVRGVSARRMQHPAHGGRGRVVDEWDGRLRHGDHDNKGETRQTRGESC